MIKELIAKLVLGAILTPSEVGYLKTYIENLEEKSTLFDTTVSRLNSKMNEIEDKNIKLANIILTLEEKIKIIKNLRS